METLIILTVAFVSTFGMIFAIGALAIGLIDERRLEERDSAIQRLSPYTLNPMD